MSVRKARCHYCHRPVFRHYACGSPDKHTIDHLTPKSRGGSNEPWNRVDCCRQCNHEKGNMTEAEYRSWRDAGRPNKEAFKRTLPHFREARGLRGLFGTSGPSPAAPDTSR